MASPPHTAGRLGPASVALMTASGFAGLGYQIVWTQQTTVWLGHESGAVLAVVAAFFGGLAVGGIALGDRIERARRPVLWYAAAELVIALWSVCLAAFMPRFGDVMLELIGARPTPFWHWTAAFCGTFVLLLPATAAMGLTLPAMERVAAEIDARARAISALYASNTLGAVLGVTVIAFWLVPALGLARTAIVCAAVNAACAAASLGLRAEASAHRSAEIALPARRRSALAPLFVTGLLGIGYEVLVVRVLSQVAEDTVYTFALLLAVYLVGSGAGAAAYHRWLARGIDADRFRDRWLGLLSAACLAGTGTLWAAEHAKALAATWLGISMPAAIAAEGVLAILAFGPATFMMGVLFSHFSAAASRAGASFGRALGINTLGAAIAPVVFGVVLYPALGPKLALLATAAGYLALTARVSWRSLAVAGPAAVAVTMAALAPPLAFVSVAAGGRVVSYRDGVMAAVSVVENENGVATLHIDNRQPEGSSATLRVDGRQAWLPLLLQDAPRRTLFLGLGTGITATAAAADPSVEVEAVELLPEVIDAAQYFMQSFPHASRVEVLAADARRYVRASDAIFELIVADNFHPARSGSGALYTVEHFAAIRARLARDGVFCQWLPLHQLDLPTLRSIVRSFVAVYGDAWAILASNSLETPVIGLVARVDGGRWDFEAVGRRLSRAPRESVENLGIEDELALLGTFVADRAALERFADGAPVNTDDRPVVTYAAPRITYAPTSLPSERLLELLAELALEPEAVLTPDTDSAVRARLAAYWAARDRFIEAGRGVRPSADVRTMLRQVRGPLLNVLRISPDFRPAYDPLLQMAAALAESDSSEARALLRELAAAQPERPEAAELLRELEREP